MTATKKTDAKDGARNGTPASADFDFGHLDIGQKEVRLDLPWVAPDAYLMVVPATEANPDFTKEILRRSSERVVVDDDDGGDAFRRDQDVRAYPGVVIKGWGGIVNKKGEEVEWSVENCRNFLRGLIAQNAAWIFDRVRGFCMNPRSFIDKPSLPDPVELAGNSSRA